MFGASEHKSQRPWVSLTVGAAVLVAGLVGARNWPGRLRQNLRGVSLLQSVELDNVGDTWFELPLVQSDRQQELARFSPGDRIGDSAVLMAGGCGLAERHWGSLTIWGRRRSLLACYDVFPKRLFRRLFGESELHSLVVSRAKRLEGHKDWVMLIALGEWGVDLFPDSAELWGQLGGAYYRTEDYDEAELALTNSVAQGGRGHYMLAKIFLEKGDAEVALQHILASVVEEEWTSDISGRWLTFAYIARAVGADQCANYCACRRLWTKENKINGGALRRLQDHLGLAEDPQVCDGLLHLPVEKVCTPEAGRWEGGE